MNASGADLLGAALAAVGLAKRKGVLRDPVGRSYMGFRHGDLVSTSYAPADLQDFLKVEYFEHYSFPGDYKVVHNPFYGMSREELELRLAVAGGRP